MAEPETNIEQTISPPEAASSESLYGLTTSLVRAVASAIDAAQATRVRELIRPLHEADLADLIERLDSDERRKLIGAAKALVGGEVLAYLDETVREEVMEHLAPKDIAAAISDLDTDDAVSVLQDLDRDDQRAVLRALPTEERLEIEEGLAFPENSAGRLMQRDLVSLPEWWTIGQTIDHMRETQTLPDEFYDIYVVNSRHEPIGTIPLNRLLRSRRPVLLRDVMERELRTIPVNTDQEDVARVFDQYNLVSTPVVGSTGRLLGVITANDVVGIIKEEAEEDALKLSGVSRLDIYRDALNTTWGRFTWLFVNLGTAILASAVIYQFDDTIAKMVGLAVLMPIVASMGGNAGSQTMAIAVRALATRDLTVVNVIRVLFKEVFVGGINGVLFALIAGLVAGLWYHSPSLGLVIGAAMIVELLAAAFAGLMIPYALWRLKIDPAPSAVVFLTTVTDVVGFLAFLGLATLFLI